MDHITIRNWRRYQHYKVRRPPWIKLHVEILDNYDFAQLEDHQKWLAVGLMLLAAKHENRVMADPWFVKNALHCSKMPDFRPLQAIGFITLTGDREKSASKALASCKQTSILETETETETETEPNLAAKSGRGGSPGFARFWAAYPRKVKRIAAKKIWQRSKLEPLTEEIVKAVEAQAESDQWLKDDGQFVPYPTTWLNAGQWTDELPGSDTGPKMSREKIEAWLKEQRASNRGPTT